jgi:phage tail-like protein
MDSKLARIAAAAAVALGLAGGARAAEGGKTPPTAFVWLVEVEGVAAYFTSCSGLGSETEVGRGEHGGRLVSRPLPVVCTRGLTSALDLWAWRRQAEQGQPARRGVKVTLLDTSLHPMAIWELSAAWPSRLVANADGTEEVTLRCDDLRRTL